MDTKWHGCEKNRKTEFYSETTKRDRAFLDLFFDQTL